MKTTTIFKSLTVLALGLIFSVNANAQDEPENPQGNTTLSVKVGEFYSLTLSHDNATISLDSEDKFRDGSTSEEIEMTIFSSKKYDVDVKVNSAQFNIQNGGTTDVNTNNIDVLVKATEGLAGNVISREFKNLNTTAQKIISSSNATKNDIYKISYEIPAGNTAAFLGEYNKTLVTEITYTLMPL
nr:hypothetical protein [uncultured Flavobacterium sp.]